MKATLIKLGVVAFVAVTLAAGQLLPSPQFLSRNGPPGGAQGGVVSSTGMGRLGFLTNSLGLNPSQQAQVKAILDEDESASKSLVEQMKQASDALESAEKLGASDNEFYALATNISSISGQLLAIDAKAASNIYALLTPEQQQKLDQLPQPIFRPSAPLLPPVPLGTSAGTVQTGPEIR